MDLAVIKGFSDELSKLAAKQDIVQLLSSSALKRGLNPGKLPSIGQVGTLAANDRGRAAEIAQNVRGFLKSQPRAS